MSRCCTFLHSARFPFAALLPFLSRPWSAVSLALHICALRCPFCVPQSSLLRLSHSVTCQCLSQVASSPFLFLRNLRFPACRLCQLTVASSLRIKPAAVPTLSITHASSLLFHHRHLHPTLLPIHRCGPSIASFAYPHRHRPARSFSAKHLPRQEAPHFICYSSLDGIRSDTAFHGSRLAAIVPLTSSFGH